MVGCIVPWNYPLLLLAWKLAPALAAGNSDGLQALGADAAVDADARAAASTTSRPGVVNLLAGAGDVGEAIVARRARRLRRVHGVGRDRQAGRGRVRRARRAREPRDGRQGPVHRLRRRGRRDRRRRQGRRLGRLPERRPGLHIGRALLRDGARCTTTTCASSSTTRAASCSAIRSTRAPTSARWCRRASARRSRRRSRRAVAAGAELVTGGGDGGHERGHFFSPAVVTGAPAETDLLREETFGPVAPIVPVSSLDEAIELANSTRYGLGCNVYTRDLADDPALHARDQGRHGLVQRPADRQRRRARSAA